jgi:alpha-amylase
MHKRRIVVLTALMIGWAGCVANGSAPGPDLPRVVTPVKPAPWWNGAVFYEVFVRSFQDSNADGVGDLPGLTAKLDYLNDGDPRTTDDLGVDALWLMPIFESPSYHGYDTTDYEHVARAYGTDADLDRLLAAAHQRGIKVVVDLVLNHTSVQHPWFLDSAASPDSPKRDWYVWSKADPGWGQPWNAGQSAWHLRNGQWYYGLFWSGMPDLNYRTEAVRAELTRVAVAWVKKGIDGFRLDAVRHLVETGPGKGQTGADENHVYLRELRAALRAANPNVALVGEVWSTTADIAPYFGQNGDDELQLLFNFPLAGALVKAAWGGDAASVIEVLNEAKAAYPRGAVDAPFLTNHDQVRVATAMSKDRARLGQAAAMLLTLPGAPFIYYGEELGLANGPGGADESKRTPMLWTAASQSGFSAKAPWQAVSPAQVVIPVDQQSADPTSLLARYRQLIRARKASPALARGTIELTEVGTSKVLAFVRRDGDEEVLVAHNLSSAPQRFTMKGRGTEAEALFSDAQASATRREDAPSGWTISLPPLGSAVYRLNGAGAP